MKSIFSLFTINRTAVAQRVRRAAASCKRLQSGFSAVAGAICTLAIAGTLTCITTVAYADRLTWLAPASLGVTITGNPTVIRLGNTGLDFDEVTFARGLDNGLWENDYIGLRWRGWKPVGGHLTSDPSAIYLDRRIHVFARGQYRDLWRRTFVVGGIHQNGELYGQWSDWVSLGGSHKSVAAVVSEGSGRLHVFTLGDDNAIWDSWSRDGGQTWSRWTSLGGNFTSAPAAVYYHGIMLFARGADDRLLTRTWNGSEWSSWSEPPELSTGNPLSFPLASAPSTCSTQLDSRGPYVFATDRAHRVRYSYFDDGHWTGWQSAEWWMQPQDRVSPVCFNGRLTPVTVPDASGGSYSGEYFAAVVQLFFTVRDGSVLSVTTNEPGIPSWQPGNNAFTGSVSDFAPTVNAFPIQPSRSGSAGQNQPNPGPRGKRLVTPPPPSVR